MLLGILLHEAQLTTRAQLLIEVILLYNERSIENNFYIKINIYAQFLFSLIYIIISSAVHHN